MGFWRKLIKSDNLVFTFVRSAASSQVASWVDMGTGVLLVALGVSPLVATPIGAVLGGIINCCINYKFTFHASGCSKVAVMVKYTLVWIGSVLLNTFGTDYLTNVLDDWHLLDMLGFTEVGSYTVARLVVSLLVSWFWNFVLQRYFVYRPVTFDKYILALARPFRRGGGAACHNQSEREAEDGATQPAPGIKKTT